MRVTGLRLLAALTVVPLLALAISGPGLALRCRAAGAIVASCCCPRTTPEPAHDGEAAPACATMVREPCCTVEAREAPRIPTEQPSTPRLEPPLVFALGTLAPPPRVPDVARARLIDARPPPPSTPILLAKRSLLI